MSLRSKIRKARKRYIRKPSNLNLRWYLQLKGKAGLFDTRMLAYYGVAGNVSPAVKRAIARAYGMGLVPTSTTGGAHAPGSYHYRRQAADLGLRRELIGTQKGLKVMLRFQRREYAAWTNGLRDNLVELIGPDNQAVVLRGHGSPLSEGSSLEQAHDNHCHVAFS